MRAVCNFSSRLVAGLYLVNLTDLSTTLTSAHHHIAERHDMLCNRGGFLVLNTGC